MKIDFINGSKLIQKNLLADKKAQDKTNMQITSNYGNSQIGEYSHAVSFGHKYLMSSDVVANIVATAKHCIYCRGEMFERADFDKIDKLSKKLPTEEFNKRMVFKFLAYNVNKLKPVEKQVYLELKDYIKNNPGTTLQQAMLALRLPHLENANKLTFGIFDCIDKKAQGLSKTPKQKILDLTALYRAHIAKQDGTFKRKKFISGLNKIISSLEGNDASNAAEIRKYAAKLPGANENVDSFFVKYSSKKEIPNSKCEPMPKLQGNSLQPQERAILNEIIEKYNNEHSGVPAQQIVNLLYPQSEKAIAEKFISAAKEIQAISKTVAERNMAISAESKKYLLDLVEDESKTSSSKRKTLFDEISKLKNLFNDTAYASIVEVVNKMPNASNSYTVLVLENYKKLHSMLENVENKSQNKKNLLYRITTNIIGSGDKSSSSPITVETLEKNVPILRMQLKELQSQIVKETFSLIQKNLEKTQEQIAISLKDFDSKNIIEQKEILAKLKTLDLPLSDGVKKELLNAIETIPKSLTDEDAFVVKFATSKINTSDVGSEYRSDREIVQSLISPSLKSLDHAKPQKEFFDAKDTKGMDNPSNLVVACCDCNGKRKETPIYELLDSHPYILANHNPQKHFNDIIKRINKGEIQNCISYMYNVTTNMYLLSKGKMKIKLNKMKGYSEKFKLPQLKTTKSDELSIEVAKSIKKPHKIRRSVRKREEFARKQAEQKSAVPDSTFAVN